MRLVARVLKSNGGDGELVLGFRGTVPDEIDIAEPLFIFYDGLAVPFFIEKITRRGRDKACVRLTGIVSLRDAEEAVGRDVYCALPASEEDDIPMLAGWRLLVQGREDGCFAEAGKVVDFMDIPANPCLEVETDKGTVLVPFHEDLIVRMDADAKEMAMRIPDGLLEAQAPERANGTCCRDAANQYFICTPEYKSSRQK